MKIFIVGASGLVGWNLWGTAVKDGHEVLGTYSTFPIPGLHKLDLADIGRLNDVFAQARPDVVFCCQSWSWVDGCEKDPSKASLLNSEYPHRLATIANSAGSHFVYYSSSYIFNGMHGPYTEEDIPDPLMVYGKTKLAGETAVLNATGGKATIIRTMGVYGPEPQKKNFVYQVRNLLGKGEKMRVPNDQIGNATYAPNLAVMSLRLAVAKEPGIWNVAGPDPNLLRSDFAIQIAKSYGLDEGLLCPVSTAELNQPAPRPLHAGLQVGKIENYCAMPTGPWTLIP